MKATLLKGGTFTDDRGTIEFVNEINPGNYRRFYLITHQDTTTVRAWQGHKKEEKAFYSIKGSFLISVICPSCFEEPTDDETPVFYELSVENNNFLRVPGGCYTGIKALTANSTLLVLSGFDLAASKEDDYRQPGNKWVDWNSI